MRGCELRHVPELGRWQVVRDASMRTTDHDVFAVGDGANIGGARFAIWRELLLVLQLRVISAAPQGDAAAREQRVQRKIRRLAGVRAFLRGRFARGPN